VLSLAAGHCDLVWLATTSSATCLLPTLLHCLTCVMQDTAALPDLWDALPDTAALLHCLTCGMHCLTLLHCCTA
jgi:hypothetical protein